MTEENQKNTVATVGMRFSIIGLIILILNIIGIATTFNETSMLLGLMIFVITLLLGIGIPLFFIGFILGFIGLFYKPKAKARIAVLIPIISIIFINVSTSAPTNEFVNWAENWTQKTTNREILDEDLVKNVFETEFKKIIRDKTKQDWISMYNSYDSINPMKKVSYLFFSIIKEGMDISLEEINNFLLIIDNPYKITADTEKNENDKNDNTSDTKTENVGVFTKEEQNDIEQILQTLE